MATSITTERLFIREFIFEDADFIIQLLNSPGWLQFIGDRNIKTCTDAINYLENGPIKSYRKFGFGLNMVMLKNEGTKIGMCGLLKRDTLPVADLGFAFLPDYNGKGYAMEAAAAVLKDARTNYSFSEIAAITLPENIRSIQLLNKLDFRFEKEFCFPDSTQPLQLYKYAIPG